MSALCEAAAKARRWCREVRSKLVSEARQRRRVEERRAESARWNADESKRLRLPYAD